MRLIFTAAVLAFTLAGATSVAGASSKFSYTQEITGSNLVLVFEEGSLKRFATLDYRLSGTARLRWEDCNGQSAEVAHEASDTVTAMPDAKGRVLATLTLEGQSGGFPCAPQFVEYTSVTLTNLTSSHVYRLDPINRAS